MDAVDAEGYPLPFCAWHADRRPVAACVRCGRTMCAACATRSADGYRCPECVRLPGAAEPAAADPGTAPAARAVQARCLMAYLGLVPVLGAPAAAAAVVLALADLKRRRGTAARSLVSLVLGLAGLAGTVLVLWLMWRRR